MYKQISENNLSRTRFLDQIFDDIKIDRDVKFREVTNFKGELEQLGVDIYQPLGDIELFRPVMLLIHGGNFLTGSSKRQSYIKELATKFSQKGYVCIANDYRVRDNPYDSYNDTLLDAISDTVFALDWIRNNCKKYNIDNNKIIIAGGSAGGIIAANLCYGKNTCASQADLSGVIALIDLWGTPSGDSLNITRESVPALIVHGTKDEYVPIMNSEKLVDKLKSKGIHHTFLKLEDAPHTPKMHMDRIISTISQFLLALLDKDK